MFQNNSKNPSSQDPPAPQVNTPIPVIHTMKDDLENSNNPNLKKEAGGSVDLKIKNERSPFLSQQNWDNSKEKKEKAEKKAGEVKHRGLGKVISSSIIIAVILLIGAGGYYFWMTRVNISENAEIQTPESVPENTLSNANNSQAELKILPGFSTSQPNYLIVSAEDFNATEVKKILIDNIKKVSEAQIVSPVEFLVTDNENNQVSFLVFAQKAGFDLKSDILDELETNFSLYIYNDNKNTRIGLAVSSKNSDQLKEALLKNEANLARELKPLYVDLSYDSSPDIIFSSSEYNGEIIRYSNIISPEELSLDYIIHSNRLIIGATKMTLRSILEYIDQQSETENKNETIEKTEVPVEGDK